MREVADHWWQVCWSGSLLVARGVGLGPQGGRANQNWPRALLWREPSKMPSVLSPPRLPSLARVPGAQVWVQAPPSCCWHCGPYICTFPGLSLQLKDPRSLKTSDPAHLATALHVTCCLLTC